MDLKIEELLRFRHRDFDIEIPFVDGYSVKKPVITFHV